MNMEEASTTYAMYRALHQVHKMAPAVWTVQECTRVLTAIMAAKSSSWRVIGITPAALAAFAEAGFRSRSGQGITRAHLRPRIDTVRAAMQPRAPLTQKAFFDTWLTNDLTVLCAKGENRKTITNYIKIDNKGGTLFSCHRKLAGWHHRAAEQDFLRVLHDRQAKSRPVRTPSKDGKAAIVRKVSRPAHNKGKPNHLHSVEVGGNNYRSAWAAWQSLEIGDTMPERKRISANERFRGQLKRSKSEQLDYTDPTTGKTYRFRLIPYNAKY